MIRAYSPFISKLGRCRLTQALEHFADRNLKIGIRIAMTGDSQLVGIRSATKEVDSALA